MKRVVVELEEMLHRRVKMEALQNDKTVKQYVTELIEKDLETKEKEQTR